MRGSTSVYTGAAAPVGTTPARKDVACGGAPANAFHPKRMMRTRLGTGTILLVGCFLALLALISPRLVLILLWIFGDLLSRAYDSWIVPFLGFFLLPWTTLAYAAFWHWGPGHHVVGFEWFFVGLAFLIDLGSYASGSRARRG